MHAGVSVPLDYPSTCSLDDSALLVLPFVSILNGKKNELVRPRFTIGK